MPRCRVARQPAAVDQPDRHRIDSGSHPFRPAGQPASALERRGSILAPLLNRQALNAQVDISQSQRNQALYAYEKTVRNAFAEVNNSLDAITRYQEQLTELLAQQDVAQETLRIAQNRYRNGYSSYLDVLDAQRTLFSVQTSVVQVKNNLLLAQIDLYSAGRRLGQCLKALARLPPTFRPVGRATRRFPQESIYATTVVCSR
jgi:outer membrane protein TolC